MKTKINQFIDQYPYLFGALALAILTLIVYGSVIFGPSDVVLSDISTDIYLGIHNVVFSFRQLAQGNFPLWNPNLLGGYPWFASFQTMMLYPPAWIFLLLPLGTALNIFLAFHVFLAGFALFCWLKEQGLHPISCILGGTLLMFSSQVTMQIYGGAVPPVATMPWMIFLLVVVDKLFDQKEPFLKWILVGSAVVAIQIMAGFPQHVYYTGLVIGIYTLARIAFASMIWRERLKVLLATFSIFAWGVLLCAIQLFTTFGAAIETSRQGKLPFHFASSFSFPPMNLITLIAPKVLGDDQTMWYAGKYNVFEVFFYFGVLGLLLAICGLLYGKGKRRFLYGGLAGLTLLVAFGRFTPFYTLLYNYVPGFGSFRANFRILFECSVFFTALAAIGFDRMLRIPRQNALLSKYQNISISMAFLVIIATFSTYWQSIPGNLGWFKTMMLSVMNSKLAHMEPRFYTDLVNVQNVAKFAALQLSISAIFLVVFCLLIKNAINKRRYIYFLALLTVGEIVFFASTMRPTFSLRATQHPTYTQFLEKHPGDKRFIQVASDNWANSLPMGLSGGNIGGYESFRLRRYEAFAQYTMGEKPQKVQPILQFKTNHPIYGLLRCKYLFDKGKVQILPNDALPHLLLVPEWKVIPDREKVLLDLNRREFNPRKTVLLESTPHFSPSSKIPIEQDQVTLINQSSDWLDIKATTTKNTILLVTDTYAKGWKVFPYADSSQQNYDVMPADYVVRGIPLAPGTHHFRLQYAPDAFYRGRTISFIALAFYLLAWCGLLGNKWRKKAKKQLRL